MTIRDSGYAAHRRQEAVGVFVRGFTLGCISTSVGAILGSLSRFL